MTGEKLSMEMTNAAWQSPEWSWAFWEKRDSPEKGHKDIQLNCCSSSTQRRANSQFKMINTVLEADLYGFMTFRVAAFGELESPLSIAPFGFRPRRVPTQGSMFFFPYA